MQTVGREQARQTHLFNNRGILKNVSECITYIHTYCMYVLCMYVRTHVCVYVYYIIVLLLDGPLCSYRRNLKNVPTYIILA